MNRQAVAFISMFSLILMLSVFYISMDDDTIQVVTPQTEEKTDDLVMKELLDEKKQEEISQQKEIIGSQYGSPEEKNEAIKKIAGIEDVKKLEDELNSLLSENGYNNLVEISEAVVRITVYGQEKNSASASNCMNLVYRLIPEDKTIEVHFG